MHTSKGRRGAAHKVVVAQISFNSSGWTADGGLLAGLTVLNR
jgi:hypothetical protein